MGISPIINKEPIKTLYITTQPRSNTRHIKQETVLKQIITDTQETPHSK